MGLTDGRKDMCEDSQMQWNLMISFQHQLKGHTVENTKTRGGRHVVRMLRQPRLEAAELSGSWKVLSTYSKGRENSLIHK